MSPAVEIIYRTALGMAVVIVAGFAVVILVGGTVGTRISRWRDRREPTTEVGGREFLLGDHPTYVDLGAGHNLDDTDGLFDEEDAPMTTGDVDAMWDNVLDGTPLPDPALRAAEIAELGPVEPEVRYYVSPKGRRDQAREVTKAEWVRAERSQGFHNTMGQPDEPGTAAFGGMSMDGWTSLTGDGLGKAWADPNNEVTAPVEHADLSRIRAFAPEAVRDRCQVGMCCVNPDRLADRCVHGAYGDVPLGCPQIEGGDYRLTAEAKPHPRLTGLTRLAADVDQHLGIDRDLPQWADTADHGPRTVSTWDQPAKPINGSAL